MIIFRVDANETIASGHLMRCCTIAKKLRDKGEEVLFCLAENKFTERLETLQIPYLILETDWKDMNSELPVFEEIIQRYKASFVVVDSYQVTKEYLERLNEIAPVLYYEDIGKERYNIDTILFPYDWGSETIARSYKETNTRVLSGFSFLPIREEFYPGERQGERVLITSGGTDTYNVCGRVLKQMEGNNTLSAMKVDVAVGGMNANIQDLKNIAEKSSLDITLHINANNMGDLMRGAGCIVTAGGTTAYEVCACRIPSVCFAFADNQVEYVENLGKNKIMISVGDVREDLDGAIQKIVAGLEGLLEDSNLRQQLQKNMAGLIDGKGADRIAEYLCKK